MVQVLYLLEVFILTHYGPPSTETSTTKRNHNRAVPKKTVEFIEQVLTTGDF